MQAQNPYAQRLMVSFKDCLTQVIKLCMATIAYIAFKGDYDTAMLLFRNLI